MHAHLHRAGTSQRCCAASDVPRRRLVSTNGAHTCAVNVAKVHRANTISAADWCMPTRRRSCSCRRRIATCDLMLLESGNVLQAKPGSSCAATLCNPCCMSAEACRWGRRQTQLFSDAILRFFPFNVYNVSIQLKQLSCSPLMLLVAHHASRPTVEHLLRSSHVTYNELAQTHVKACCTDISDSHVCSTVHAGLRTALVLLT